MCSRLVLARSVLAVLAIPFLLDAHELSAGDDGPHHHGYRLVDLRTLGGPTHLIDCCDSTQPVLNNHGLTVGGGADPADPNPNQAISCPLLAPDPFINVGVVWFDAKARNLGALPGGFNSFANSVNGSGAIVGASETGETDPILGTVSCHPVRNAAEGFSLAEKESCSICRRWEGPTRLPRA